MRHTAPLIYERCNTAALELAVRLGVYNIGEWHLSVWVTKESSDAECLRLGEEIEAAMKAWAEQLHRRLPLGHRIARTEVSP